MSISALSSTSAASQLSFLSRLRSTNANSSAQGVRPPPPPPDGGGFADAIAEALKSIDISDSGSDTATTASSSDSGGKTDSTDVTAALGSFLQSLMGALHGQRSEGADAPPPYGDEQGGGSAGPGKLQSDLQSLPAKLTSGTTGASGDDSELESSAVATCHEVYATSGYSASVRNMAQISLSSDMVFSDGQALQMGTVTGNATDGYAVTLTVGVAA
jgi:hypothetical protein